MSKIHLLDQLTIDKISAGEVIERPASIVKELIENSIDAKATAITVEIKDGGIGFIRVTDNGMGIEKDDIKTAFLRHATSKLKSVDDLITISSLGFRGEALSSITAVSEVELVTKTDNNIIGCRYEINGGKEKAFEEIGCPEGTTFIIRNLFSNIPARRKFLKSPSTEASHINELVQKLALSHPEISIKFINNGQTRLYTTGNMNVQYIIHLIYGKDVASNLIEINYKSEKFSISGYIGKPILSRGNRSVETLFVNNRYLKSTFLYKTIEEAYKGFSMQHMYPFVCIYINIKPELLDVNVHPSKMEIRFKNSEELSSALIDVIRNALLSYELIPKINIGISEKREIKKENIPEPFEKNRIIKNLNNRQIADKKVDNKNIMSNSYKAPFKYKENAIKSDFIREVEVQAKQLNLFNEKLINGVETKKYKIIGQLFKTYWLLEYEQQLFIVDQHAAHEKVLYERILKRYKNKEIFKQQIAPPIIVTLNMQEENILKKFETYFKEIGFTIENFGGNEYCIREAPSDLLNLAEKNVFIELLDNISENQMKLNSNLLLEKIASIACKSAIKGNTNISIKEIEKLMDDLFLLENPYNCPHGRPTIIAMTKSEIERKFKRII